MISASIVTYNTDLAELGKCLDSITKCHKITNIDIIDNSKNKHINKFLTNNYPQINYIPNDNNGYGAGNNISIRRSIKKIHNDIKYHLVLNSDIIFTPDVIDTLIEKMKSDDTIGLIMPAVVGKDGEPQSCCHPLPSPIDLILHRCPAKYFRKWRARYDISATDYDFDINVPYMHGCFMLFNIEALKTVGLFDERFFMYPEDIDITRRIHRRYKTLVTPEAVITHYHRGESRHNLKMLRIHIWNMLKYYWKWGFFIDKERTLFNKQLQAELNRKK